MLRKSRRIGDDAPDSVVWDEAGPTDPGRHRRHAARHPGAPRRPGDERPPRPHRRLGHPRHYGSGAAKPANEEGPGSTSTAAWARCGVETDGADLATLLDGVLLDLAPVVLDAPDALLDAARAFLEYAGGRELADGTNLGVDATAAADDGSSPPPTSPARAGTLGLVVDGTAVHDRGASDVQELAHSLAVGGRGAPRPRPTPA